ncbi:MAG: hypothetical protein ABI262_15315, partial [Microcoleus sp.]
TVELPDNSPELKSPGALPEAAPTPALEAIQNWQLIPAPEVASEAAPEVVLEAPEPAPEVTPEPTATPAPESAPEPTPEATPETVPAPEAALTPEPEPMPAPERAPTPAPAPEFEIGDRVIVTEHGDLLHKGAKGEIGAKWQDKDSISYQIKLDKKSRGFWAIRVTMPTEPPGITYLMRESKKPCR